MPLRWVLASLHLLGLGIGLGAVWARAQALQSVPAPDAVRRVLRADTWWGVAALVWLGTGLPRLLWGIEKPTGYYLGSPVFWLKMGLFALILLLEVTPIVTFARWRSALGRGQQPDTTSAPRLAAISRLEAALVLAIVFAATAVARAIGPH